MPDRVHPSVQGMEMAVADTDGDRLVGEPEGA